MCGDRLRRTGSTDPAGVTMRQAGKHGRRLGSAAGHARARSDRTAPGVRIRLRMARRAKPACRHRAPGMGRSGDSFFRGRWCARNEPGGGPRPVSPHLSGDAKAARLSAAGLVHSADSGRNGRSRGKSRPQTSKARIIQRVRATTRHRKRWAIGQPPKETVAPVHIEHCAPRLKAGFSSPGRKRRKQRHVLVRPGGYESVPRGDRAVAQIKNPSCKTSLRHERSGPVCHPGFGKAETRLRPDSFEHINVPPPGWPVSADRFDRRRR